MGVECPILTYGIVPPNTKPNKGCPAPVAGETALSGIDSYASMKDLAEDVELETQRL